MSLTVSIYSFSYKKSGIPKDKTEHGGGFVFDCRFIYNPGREEKYKSLSGKDNEVIEFLTGQEKMEEFLHTVYKIIDPAIENYIERDFTSLMISFGCTGGQHRSVFAAEKVQKHIEDKFDHVHVEVFHTDLPLTNSN
jgi:RNase adaptor protein for sRNA GlmZ degradation